MSNSFDGCSFDGHPSYVDVRWVTSIRKNRLSMLDNRFSVYDINWNTAIGSILRNGIGRCRILSSSNGRTMVERVGCSFVAFDGIVINRTKIRSTR